MTHWHSPKYPDQPELVDLSRDALQHMGTNAIPHRLRWISYERGGIRDGLDRQLRQRVAWAAPVHEYLQAPIRQAGDAEIGFYLLGPVARPAIPELLKLAISSSPGGRVLNCTPALCAIGPDAIPALLTISTNSSGSDSEFVLSYLTRLLTNAHISATVQ
jgi:hypothetical protein